jgi:hypothetical protein
MSRSRAASAILCIGAAFLVVACASRPQANDRVTGAASGAPRAAADAESDAAVKAGKPQAPRRLDRTQPDLRIEGPIRGSTERSQRYLEISVDIDVDGRPDMSTLRITGAGAAENRNAVMSWVSAGVYEPGRDGLGRSVRAPYRIRFLLGGS